MTAFGRPRRHYRVTDSTNERARALAAAGAPSGTVVTAARQTAGRGRRGRTWSAPPGGALLYSAIVRPMDSEHPLLSLAAPVAVCEAIEEAAPVECAIKWPNDVWIAEPTGIGRKVAGVLIEARAPEWAVVGIGVNVAAEPDGPPDDLRWPATSVGRGVTVEALRAALDGALGAWVDAGRGEVLDAFRGRDALRGREVCWGDGEVRSGTADGVDDDGSLLVAVPGGGRVALGSGEVSIRLG